MEPTSKERVLKKIRKALIHKTSVPFPNTDQNLSVYKAPEDSLDIIFAQEFTKIQGNFIYCASINEFINSISHVAEEKKWNHLFCWENPLQDLFQRFDFNKCRVGKSLDKADAGVTLCECLIARTGTVLLSSRQLSGRTLPIFPPVHITVAYTSQLFFDLKDATQFLQKKYEGNLPSMISFATGPSRTADIEKTLVLGAHGPKEVYVFLIDDPVR
ncbi:MAG TPA: hypothetical protein DCQ93_08120 [Bacteroidetes bacterium]|nr:hypothetical protein [Bacteroidota bacterium]